MATKTIHAFTAITSIEGADEILAWDDSANTTRKITWANALTNATLVTPTIASFTNAQHTHANAAGGGTLTDYLAATGATTGATSQAQTFTNGIQVGDGTVGAPAVTFVSDTDVGAYRISANWMGFVAGGVAIASARLVSTSRIFWVGDGTNPVSLNINGAAGQPRDLTFNSGGSVRWIYRVDNAAESGSNAGSNFTITSRTDAGGALATALFITRATGYVGLNNITTPTAGLHVGASASAGASVRIPDGTAPTTPNAGDIWNDGALSFYNAGATTNAIVNHLRLSRDSTGTPAAGLGLGILAELESTTTSRQSAGRLTWEWATATHASRAAKGKLTAYYTSTEREAITWVADSSSVSVGINTSTPGRMLDVVGSDIYIRAYKDADEYAELRSLGVIYATRGANTFSIDAQYGGVGAGGPAAIINSAAIKMSGNDGSYPNQLYLTADGKVGLNTASPSGLLHGHDGSGGFLFVNQASVGGTLVTVIPDAAGDVTEKIFFVGWCTNSVPFSADVAPTTLTVSSSTTKTDGTNTLTIAVTAGGAFTLQATGGAATWNVNLWVFWR